MDILAEVMEQIRPLNDALTEKARVTHALRKLIAAVLVESKLSNGISHQLAMALAEAREALKMTEPRELSDEDMKVPRAKVFSRLGWFYRIENEDEVGPFETTIKAGKACRAELIRRAEAKEALK